MDLAEALSLALIQGFTEFLPISSSGHLILTPAVFGWPEQGLGFDIAVHFGTLSAVVVYFRKDLRAMAGGLLEPASAEGRLARQLLLASIPLGIAGLLSAEYVETVLRSPLVIGMASVVFGVLLYAADRWGRGERIERELGFGEVLLIGVGQALALIPGTSRSGITMTVALALGLDRAAAGRFAFLLSIPAIVMATVWEILEFTRAPEALDFSTVVPATLLAAVTAFITIALFLRWISRIGMAVFAVYRILLAGAIFYLLV